MQRLEFWPDYGGVLLHADGRAVALDRLGLPSDLIARTQAWLDGYDDARVDPVAGDQVWVDEGRVLFDQLRAALAPAGFDVFDWEGLWGGTGDEPGSA